MGESESRNGQNGYLADGQRLQVPEWFKGQVYVTCEFEAPALSLAANPNQDIARREHLLRRLHYFCPPGVSGPVEGDGTWHTDELTGGRIITLFVEAGSSIWERVHRRPWHGMG